MCVPGASSRRLVRDGIAHVAISLGVRGALFADGQGVLYAEGVRVDAVSTVGAGDALTAALLFSLAGGHSREETAKLAVATATAKVTCPGSSPPGMEAIRRYHDLVIVTALQ